MSLCFAHFLTGRKFLAKFNETHSKGSGDMERTRKCYGGNEGLTDGRSHEKILVGYFLC